MSNSGTVNYFNEMFLGKEELSKKQEMERSAFLGILNIFGQHGLFDLKSQGAQLELVYDPQTATCNINLKFQNSTMKVLGFAEGRYPLVASSMLSTKIVKSSRPDADDKFYVCLTTTQLFTEDGTVTVSEDGTVIGTGTSFTKILRGGKRQSRVKIGTYIFSVSHVENDTLLYLQGSDFPELFDMKFSILPTLSPFSEENNNPIYEYDSCILTTRTGAVPNEVNVFQIAEFNWSDVVSGLIQGSSSDWFSQKTFMGNFLLPESVGSEELKPESVGPLKLDPSLKPVDNMSINSTVSGNPIAISLSNYLSKPSDSKAYWTLTKLQIAPNTIPTKTVGLGVSGFSEITFAAYPEELKFIIERLNIDQTSGHSIIKVTIGDITFDFPQGAFRTVICFKKNLADLKYEYLYHVNCS